MTAKKRSRSERPPLTTEELEQITAEDLIRLKLTQDEKLRLREINKRRERERAEKVAEWQRAEEPLVEELREVGRNVGSVWDLVNTTARYPEAVPVLLKHLKRPYSDRIREGIARALAIPEARSAWTTLAAEYRKALGDSGLGAKDGLAVALSATVTVDTLDELIALAKDRSHGSSRLLLLPGLKKQKNKNPAVKQAIDELSTDPDLKKEIASWKWR